MSATKPTYDPARHKPSENAQAEPASRPSLNVPKTLPDTTEVDAASSYGESPPHPHHFQLAHSKGKARGQSDDTAPHQRPPYKITGLLFAFAQIEPNHHAECQKFIGKYPNVLEDDEDLILDEAFHATINKQNQYARSCIQRAVVLQYCSGLSKRGTQEYLDDLCRGEKSVLKEFFKSCDRVATAISNRVLAHRKPLQPYLAPDSSSAPRFSNTALKKSTASHIGVVNSKEGTKASHLPTNEMESLSLNKELPRSYDGAVRALSYDLTNPEDPEQREHGEPDMPSALPDQNLRHGSRGKGGTFTSSVDLQSINIKGKSGGILPDSEDLDPRYRVRSDAKKFFDVGCVFALLWHEPAGNAELAEAAIRLQEVELGECKTVTYTKGPLGQYIYSHIRRMVVVRWKTGFCWAIPINTYGGHGVARKKFPPAELEAHTVVHETTRKAYTVPGEEGLTKDPIAIKMAKGQQLDKMSRLTFGQPCTVQWNVKVMEVGWVSKESMKKLEAYWQTEVDGTKRRAGSAKHRKS